MCGRFTLTEINKLEERYSLKLREKFKPNYNIAPTQKTPIITKNGIIIGTFGLIPAWNKNKLLINARAETIMEKMTYKESAEEKRCLIPADGFYEWKDKQPYRAVTGRIFSMAGIYNEDKSFAVITCKANKQLKNIHERMPVILNKDDEKKWLERFDKKLLKSYEGNLKVSPRGKDVSDVRNNCKELIKPI